jgi:hypothetical protein
MNQIILSSSGDEDIVVPAEMRIEGMLSICERFVDSTTAADMIILVDCCCATLTISSMALDDGIVAMSVEKALLGLEKVFLDGCLFFIQGA